MFSLVGGMELLSSPVPLGESSPDNMDGIPVVAGLEMDDVALLEMDDVALVADIVDILDRRGGPAE